SGSSISGGSCCGFSPANTGSNCCRIPALSAAVPASSLRKAANSLADLSFLSGMLFFPFDIRRLGLELDHVFPDVRHIAFQFRTRHHPGCFAPVKATGAGVDVIVVVPFVVALLAPIVTSLLHWNVVVLDEIPQVVVRPVL